MARDVINSSGFNDVGLPTLYFIRLCTGSLPPEDLSGYSLVVAEAATLVLGSFKPNSAISAAASLSGTIDYAVMCNSVSNMDRFAVCTVGLPGSNADIILDRLSIAAPGEHVFVHESPGLMFNRLNY